MRKFFVFILSAALLLGSFSYSFAAATDWSTTDQSNLQNASSRLTNINSLLNSGGALYTLINNINNALRYTNGSTNVTIGRMLNDIANDTLNIANTLALTSNNPLMAQTVGGLASLGQMFHDNFYIPNSGGSSETVVLPSLYNYLINTYGFENQGGTYGTPVHMVQPLGGQVAPVVNFSRSNWITNLFSYIVYFNRNIVDTYRYTYQYMATDHNSMQSALDWTDINNNISFTPTSISNGLYSWLSYIQSPVSRLAYIFANDDQIAAREAAADNEAAVVDQFIDPSGAGSASTSDIGSISSASDGFKTNFSTDASASGIWSIFDSSNGNWFSQEIASSLDTSSGANRSVKYSAPLMISGPAIKARNYNYDYETPALDKQVNEIMSLILGGDKK